MTAGRRVRTRAAAVLALLSVLPAGGCAQPGDAGQGQIRVTVLSYQEQEAGVQPYPLRMLVNAQYLRFDDGYDGSDYMLMERDSGTIYSVNHDERSILVIAAHPAAGTLPEGVVLSEQKSSDAAAPRIADRPPLHIRFLANGTVCHEAVVVPGLLEGVTVALAEYATALGNRQFGELETVPAEMLTPCFLSRYVYAPARHLQYGLPVQEWDESGYRRMLVDYREEQPVDAAVFTLPEGYRKYEPGLQRPAGQPPAASTRSWQPPGSHSSRLP